MTRMNREKHQFAIMAEVAAVLGISFTAILQKFISESPDARYRRYSHAVEAMLNEWKQMAGVPVISVFERVDRMPVEVREALKTYIIKLEASN